MKNYLLAENDRNERNHDLLEKLVRLAFGQNCEVLVAHHVTFENHDGNKGPGESQPDEIPSADTLIFDHELMTKVFGDAALPLMARCSQVPCDQREALVAQALEKVQVPA